MTPATATVATMTPNAAAAATAAGTTASGPTTQPVTFNAAAGYDYPGIAYNAATFTPGAASMTPA